MARKYLTLTIKDLEWKFFLQTPAAYKRMHGSDSEGITYPEEQEVWLNKKFFSPRTIRHELMHVYVASCNTESSNLNTDQMEDHCCSIVGHHFDAIAMHCTTILEFFKGSG